MVKELLQQPIQLSTTMRPLVALIGCAIFLATATTTCAAARSSIANAGDYSQDDRAFLDKSSTASISGVGEQPHTIRYINRSRELKKNSGRRRKKGGNNSLSNAGGRADTRNNNGNKKNKKNNAAVEEEPPVIVSTTPIVEPDSTTNSESGSTVSITTKNGGTVYEYEFTTPGGPIEEEEEEVGTDSIVLLEEDVVDILATTTAAPSTASPSVVPTTSAPTAPTASPTPVPTPSHLTVGPTTTAHASGPCGISSFRRRVALMLMATEASGNIYDGTPQKAALDWLVDIDAYQVCPDDPNALQRYTLAVFYYSTLGDEWLDCSVTPNFEESTCDSVTVGTVGNDDSPK